MRNAAICNELAADVPVKELSAKYGLTRHTIYSIGLSEPNSRYKQKHERRTKVVLERLAAGEAPKSIASSLGVGRTYVYNIYSSNKRKLKELKKCQTQNLSNNLFQHSTKPDSHTELG